MLAGLCIELRHGSEVARALVRAHLREQHANVVDHPPTGHCVVVDLEDCGRCSQSAVEQGPVVLVEDSSGVRVSMRVEVERVYEDLVPAICLVGRIADLLPGKVNPAGSAAPSMADLSLSERERQVILGIAEGKSNKVIGRDLGITAATVKVHMRSILRKTGTANRTQTALWVVRNLPGGAGRLTDGGKSAGQP